MQYTEEELNALADQIERAFRGEEMPSTFLDRYSWDEELFCYVEPVLKKKVQDYQKIREWLWTHFRQPDACQMHSMESWRGKQRKQQKEKLENLLKHTREILDADEQFLRDVVMEESERYGTMAADYLQVAIDRHGEAMDYLNAAIRALESET